MASCAAIHEVADQVAASADRAEAAIIARERAMSEPPPTTPTADDVSRPPPDCAVLDSPLADP
ncbi:MAG: hypothetical protein LBK95_13860 [Bifidobacteriaceae bacterium]|nr:hypothetical protein [Bifidobacteriaceae bacterium]